MPITQPAINASLKRAMERGKEIVIPDGTVTGLSFRATQQELARGTYGIGRPAQ